MAKQYVVKWNGAGAHTQGEVFDAGEGPDKDLHDGWLRMGAIAPATAEDRKAWEASQPAAPGSEGVPTLAEAAVDSEASKQIVEAANPQGSPDLTTGDLQIAETGYIDAHKDEIKAAGGITETKTNKGGK